MNHMSVCLLVGLGSHYVAQAVPELKILLPQFLYTRLDGRHVLPCLAMHVCKEVDSYF